MACATPTRSLQPAVGGTIVLERGRGSTGETPLASDQGLFSLISNPATARDRPPFPAGGPVRDPFSALVHDAGLQHRGGAGPVQIDPMRNTAVSHAASAADALGHLGANGSMLEVMGMAILRWPGQNPDRSRDIAHSGAIG